MAYFSGHAGTLSLGGATTLSITKWEMTKRNALADITNSGSSGNRTWIATIDEAEYTADFIFDDTVLVDTDLLADTGTTVAVVLTAGSSGKTYSFSSITEEIRINNPNNQGAVTGTIRGKSTGVVTNPST